MSNGKDTVAFRNLRVDRQACYRALRKRDPRLDGRIFVAVRTTRIYCRPVCPARCPKLENVVFYSSAAAAQRAGYRPCLRCKPTSSRPEGERPMVDSQEFTLERVPSPLGELLVVCDRAGKVRALDFDDYEPRMRRLLRRHYGDGGFRMTTGRVPAAVTAALAAFFDGKLRAIDAVPVQTGGTEFQRRVWAALRRIPPGATTSYGALATAIGRPGASRAVGLANGSNPIVVVVPCHRVVGSDGTLTGYGGGVDRKRWLLDHERRWTKGMAA